MKKLLLSLGLALMMSGIVQAKIPPEVMEPYKAYQAALEQKDTKSAGKHALIAWQKAEELLGESKTTADLAQNYADVIRPSDRKSSRKALRRAIDLTDISLPRGHVSKTEKLISLGILEIMEDNPKAVIKVAAELKSYVTDSKLSGGTYEADYHVLNGWGKLRKRKPRAENDIKRAIEIYESPSHNYSSALEYIAYVYNGDILINEDKYIDAALSYQKVMQSLENYVDSKNATVQRAFSGWMFALSLLADDGKFAEAEQAGVCKCWPYDEMKDNDDLPVLRIAPVMPSRAERSGRVIVRFDVNEDGKPINIKAIQATERVFVKPAVKSVQYWQFDPFENGGDSELRTGIVKTITFRLYDGSGKVIGERKLKSITQ